MIVDKSASAVAHVKLETDLVSVYARTQSMPVSINAYTYSRMASIVVNVHMCSSICFCNAHVYVVDMYVGV